MANHSLSEEEMRLVAAALRLAADGSAFDDSEFQTLFGLERQEVRAVADAWPDVDLASEEVECAVVNSLNNLLGYPHGMDDYVQTELGSSYVEIHAVQHRIGPLLGSRRKGEDYVSWLR